MSRFEGRYAGKTAIITGAASGLGRAVAQRIVAEGGIVSLWDLNPEPLAAAAAEAGHAHTVSLDVANPEAVAAAARASASALGRVDILVCSAGITGATASLMDFPIDSWQRVININLNGAFYCCRAVVPFMLANDYGRIVNVSSVAGKEGNPNASAYSASKAGLIGLTKSLAKELAGTGIVANSLTPATFDSPILQQMPQSQVDYMLAKIPMRRLGQVGESAAMVCFMASEECSFTTGAVFDTSGGRSTY